MTNAETDVSATLARFGSELQLTDIPDPVISQVETLFLDAVASALTGWTSPETGQVRDTAEKIFGSGNSVVIGGSPMSMAGAAMVNGYLVTARSFCDMHRPTLCHVTPVVVPPVLALAEKADVDGATFLTALCAGFETNVRIALGLDYPTFRSKGWHTPGVAGLISASIAGGRVLGLTADEVERVMGLAASQAGGTFASYGTPTIKFHQARAAAAALAAVVLGSSGFVGPKGVLDAIDGGVFNTFSDGGDPEVAVAGLGEEWRLMEITVRLWPAAAALQSILTILEEEATPPLDGVDSVVVSLPPANFEMNSAMGWASTFEATLSARYVTASALLVGDFWLDHLQEERLGDPRVSRFAEERVTVVEDPSLPEAGARVLFRLSSGETKLLSRDHPRGSPEFPAGWGDVAAKLSKAAEDGSGSRRAEEIARAVGSLRNLSSVSELTKLLGS